MNTEPKRKETGAFIGSIIIVILLVIVAIYFWKNEIEKQRERAVQSEQIQKQNESAAEALQAIENELSAPEPNIVSSPNATTTK